MLLISILFCINETIQKTKNFQTIIENIDIGGPTLVRAAAKNFNDVTVITDKKDYRYLIDELNKNNGSTGIKFRQKCHAKLLD